MIAVILMRAALSRSEEGRAAQQGRGAGERLASNRSSQAEALRAVGLALGGHHTLALGYPLTIHEAI